MLSKVPSLGGKKKDSELALNYFENIYARCRVMARPTVLLISANTVLSTF